MSKEVSVSVADERRSRKATSSGIIEQRPAGVAVECKLISVNDVEETFHVALLIHTHYKDSSVKPNRNAPDEFLRDESYNGFIPKLIMVNCVATQYEEFDCVVRVNHRTAEIWTSFQNVCHFNESLELFTFPFDRQLFRVGFKSPNSLLEPWRLDTDILDYPPQIVDGQEADNTSPYLVSCELNTWTMASIAVGIHNEDNDPVALSATEFELTIRAERDPVFFLKNYVTLMWAIVVLNAANVSLGPGDLGDRLALSMTLLLTAVAFKHALGNVLPKVGYSTWMDSYILLGFAFLTLSTLENLAVSPRLRCMDVYFTDGADKAAYIACENSVIGDVTRLDAWFHLGYAAIWTLINLLVTIVSYFPNLLRESWEFIDDNQIGDIEASISRTNVVLDLDNEEKGAILV